MKVLITKEQLKIIVNSLNNPKSKNKIVKWLNKSIIYVKESWSTLQNATKLEKEETLVALIILRKVLTNNYVSDKEKRFLKMQSLDLVKILFLIITRFIPVPLPILPTLIWISKKTRFNFFPNSHLKQIEDIETPNNNND
jgi:hypothetical protein